jgi:CheY-like chemotaxis protein
VSRRVLVVDDEEAIREIAAISLEAVGGHEVVTAGSGQEALQQAAAEPLDAVLLDVMMPGLDGPGTLHRLQADPATRDIGVILLTAKVQATERTELGRLPGVAGVITKPFDPMTLAQQVASILGWGD